jgi:GntR family transcriptional regulator
MAPPDSQPFPYQRIADDLRAEILSGRLAPGQRLPSERDISDQYQTTRPTVRKALAVLRADGLVLTEQGRGAFVRPRPHMRHLARGALWRERRGSGVAPWNAEVAAQGQAGEQRIVEVATTGAPADIAALLDLDEGAPVVVRRRVLLVDGEPAQLADSYYPADLAAGTALLSNARIRGGAASVIEDQLGRRIARFVEELSGRMPTPAEARELRLPPGVPVVRALRTAYDSEGGPVEVLDSRIPMDRHTLRYEIEVPPGPA